MPVFRYIGVDGEGSVVKGRVEAVSSDSAWRVAELAIAHIIEVSEEKSLLAPLMERMRSRQVRRETLIGFARDLAVMLSAGIPISGALSDLAEAAENPYFRGRIENIRSTIAMGSSLSDAVKMHQDIFPEIFLRLVAVGEETGTLDGSLNDAADHLQRLEDLSSAIKSAMIYPIFALVSAMGALIFWLVYVLPKVLVIFKDMHIKIPAVTRFLMFTSDLTQRYWWILILLPILLVISYKILRRNEELELITDRMKLRVPVLGLILNNRILGSFSEQMRILTKAGLTIDRSFDLAGKVVVNRVYRDALVRVKEQVLSGSSVSEALSRQRVFPPMLLRMVRIGESSGTLEEQFAFLSAYYLKRLDEISARLGKLLEPLVILFLGIMFAVIIIGLLLPVYDLISNVGRM